MNKDNLNEMIRFENVFCPELLLARLAEYGNVTFQFDRKPSRAGLQGP